MLLFFCKHRENEASVGDEYVAPEAAVELTITNCRELTTNGTSRGRHPINAGSLRNTRLLSRADSKCQIEGCSLPATH